MFFVVSGLILAVAIYSQAPLLFWAFGLMVGALIVSVLMSWMMLRRLTVQRVIPSHGVAGEAMLLRYQLFNPHRLIPAFGVIVNETWGRGKNGWRKSGPLAMWPRRLKGRPLGWVAHIGPGQHLQAEASCWPLRRGYLALEKIQLSTAFPFGIIRRVREFETSHEVLVYPRLIRVDKRVLFKLSDMDPFGRERIERGGGHEEFYGLREYRPGDSLKMIDWRHSARTGKLITREMTQPSPPKIMVALDLTAMPMEARKEKFHPDQQMAGDSAVEKAISMTASLVCDAYFNGYQIGLVVLGVPFTPFPVHHSLPHRTKILEALAQLDTSRRSDRAQALPAKPNVIIRPSNQGDGDKPLDVDQLILDASSIDDTAQELAEGSHALLEGRAAPRTRRQQIREGASWG